ncbi:MAG TPA: LLM class flavin-dependent oxidoreductase [Chloroflexota bacterium]|nr:LLM class flavin-dependent oxidoreductase [Chloroflexota bacterium]
MAEAVERAASDGAGTAELAFGIFDWIDADGGPLGPLYERRLRMLEYADRAGYWGYHVAEHHGTPLGMAPSPSVFLAAAAQRTRRLRLGPMVYVLPLYNPMRLAEEIVMLDHLSGGRLELGIGRGSVAWELEMLAVEPAETKARYDEALAVILAALTTGAVTFEGRYYQFRGATLPAGPVQRPYPPLWYPTSNPATVPWLAEQGYNTLFSFNTPTLQETRRRLDLYRAHRAKAACNPHRVNPHVAVPKYGMARKVYVAETDAAAQHVAAAALDRFRANFTYLHERHGVHTFTERLGDFAACLERGTLFAGAPATVAARISAFLAGTGGNYFAGCFAWGDLTDDQVLRSLHLFTTEVIPAVRARLAAPAAASPPAPPAGG